MCVCGKGLFCFSREQLIINKIINSNIVCRISTSYVCLEVHYQNSGLMGRIRVYNVRRAISPFSFNIIQYMFVFLFLKFPPFSYLVLKFLSILLNVCHSKFVLFFIYYIHFCTAQFLISMKLKQNIKSQNQ